MCVLKKNPVSVHSTRAVYGKKNKVARTESHNTIPASQQQEGKKKKKRVEGGKGAVGVRDGKSGPC